MATSSTGVHTKEKREKAPIGYTDMGCTLPLFPGDVRDSMCHPPGGSDVPIHPHSVTLPQIGEHCKCVSASIAA